MNPRIAILSVWCGIALIAAAQFGGFRTDQPFLARSMPTGPCSDLPTPYDDMESYTNAPVALDGLDGGCWWNGAYVDHPNTNLPAIMHQDLMSTYAETNYYLALNTLNGGISWTTYYLSRTYENLPLVHYADAMDEYTNTAALNGLAKGTNWYASVRTNQPSAVAWTNAYVAKDY